MILKSIKLLISKKKLYYPSAVALPSKNTLIGYSVVRMLRISTHFTQKIIIATSSGGKKVGGATLGWLHLEMDEMSLFQAWLLLDMPMHKYKCTIPPIHRYIHTFAYTKLKA